MTKEEKEREELYNKIGDLLPVHLLDEVIEVIDSLEEELKEKDLKIEELTDEVDDLEDQVKDAEDSGKLDYHMVEDWITSYSHGPSTTGKQLLLEVLLEEVRGEGTGVIILPHSHDMMQYLLIPKLEEYINQHGVEDTLDKLTQPQVDPLELKQWEDYSYRLQKDLDEAQNTIYELGKNPHYTQF